MKSVLIFSFIFAAQGSLSEKFRCESISDLLHMDLTCVDINPIAWGTTATLYHLTDKKSQHFAAKVVFHEDFEEEADWKTAVQEAAILQRFNHPNIIRLHKGFKSKELLILLLDFGTFGSADAFFGKYPELVSNPYAVINFSLGISRGVQEVHSKGYAIADLKLENVVIDANLEPKLIDLALAKPLNVESTSICGTSFYIDPRLFLPKWNRIYDEKNDVFAFGSILLSLYLEPGYEMPVSEQGLIASYENGVFPIRAKVEKTIVDLISRCRQVDPTKRPTFKQIIFQLELLLETDLSWFARATKLNMQEPKTWDLEADLFPEPFHLSDFRTEFEEFKKNLVKPQTASPESEPKKGLGWVFQKLCFWKKQKRALMLATSTLGRVRIGSGYRSTQHQRLLQTVNFVLSFFPFLLASWLLILWRRSRNQSPSSSGEGDTTRVSQLDAILENPNNSPDSPKTIH